jgi:hypothetical protein
MREKSLHTITGQWITDKWSNPALFCKYQEWVVPFHTMTVSQTDSKAAAAASHAFASTCEPADGLSGQTVAREETKEKNSTETKVVRYHQLPSTRQTLQDKTKWCVAIQSTSKVWKTRDTAREANGTKNTVFHDANTRANAPDQPGDPYKGRPGHFSQAVEPTVLANVPSGHGPHDEKPLSEKTPALQTSHEVDLGLFE